MASFLMPRITLGLRLRLLAGVTSQIMSAAVRVGLVPTCRPLGTARQSLRPTRRGSQPDRCCGSVAPWLRRSCGHRAGFASGDCRPRRRNKVIGQTDRNPGGHTGTISAGAGGAAGVKPQATQPRCLSPFPPLLCLTPSLSSPGHGTCRSDRAGRSRSIPRSTWPRSRLVRPTSGRTRQPQG